MEQGNTDIRGVHGMSYIRAEIYECENEPYKCLAMAIVQKAIQDYKMACRAKAKGGEGKYFRECERFFESDYAQLLTDLDLPDIAKKIKREAGLL